MSAALSCDKPFASPDIIKVNKLTRKTIDPKMVKRDLFFMISFHAIFIVVPSYLFDIFSLTNINEWNMNGSGWHCYRWYHYQRQHPCSNIVNGRIGRKQFDMCCALS